MDMMGQVTEAGTGVTPAQTQEVTPQVTPGVEGGVADATPTQEPSRDAELSKLAEDINRLKAAAQRREWEQSQRYQAQLEAYQQKLAETERVAFEAQTRGLEPEQKKVAEAAFQWQQRERELQSQIQGMQAQMNQLTQSQQIAAQRDQAVGLVSYLTGISVQDLANHAEDPDSLVAYARSRIQQTQQQAQRQPLVPPAVTRERPSTSTGGIVSKWLSGQMTPQQIQAQIDRAKDGGIPLSEL